MALIKCHECGKEVSGEARQCPHCGAKRKKKAGPIAWMFAGIVLFSIIVIGPMTEGQRDAAEAERRAALTPEQRTAEDAAIAKANRLSSARGACLITLKEQLHDPDSAQFGLTSNWYTSERKDGTILVQPVGRAKNAFGAYINSTWECVVRPEGTNIRVLALKQIQP